MTGSEIKLKKTAYGELWPVTAGPRYDVLVDGQVIGWVIRWRDEGRRWHAVAAARGSLEGTPRGDEWRSREEAVEELLWWHRRGY